jgi:3-oxoacyl-[acyl-carrier protein] reductase
VKKTPKDILLTGASGEIGRTVARRLARSGFRVHLAVRDLRRLQPRPEELAGAPAYRFDLGDLPECERLVKSFFRRAKNPWGLVCNAGNLGPVGRYWEIPPARWRRSIEENFLSHAAMIQAFAKAMSLRRRPGGAIVVMSGAGVGNAGDFADVTSYSTAKAALVHLVEALSGELRDLNITINAVAPGAVLSSMTEQARRGGKAVPKGFVPPDLAAQMIQFLMSSAARPMSGRLFSARFDQKIARRKGKSIDRDPHWYRLRRIDYELFAPKRRKP